MEPAPDPITSWYMAFVYTLVRFNGSLQIPLSEVKAYVELHGNIGTMTQLTVVLDKGLEAYEQFIHEKLAKAEQNKQKKQALKRRPPRMRGKK